MKPQKTYKREVATILLGFLCYLAFNSQIQEIEILAWPFVTFAMAAFGLEAYNNQTIPNLFKRSKSEEEK